MQLFFGAYMIITSLPFPHLFVELTCILKEYEGRNILLCDLHKLVKISVT
jgi:hypothetical protein